MSALSDLQDALIAANASADSALKQLALEILASQVADIKAKLDAAS